MNPRRLSSSDAADVHLRPRRPHRPTLLRSHVIIVPHRHAGSATSPRMMIVSVALYLCALESSSFLFLSSLLNLYTILHILVSLFMYLALVPDIS